jgi:hypothetical protein
MLKIDVIVTNNQSIVDYLESKNLLSRYYKVINPVQLVSIGCYDKHIFVEKVSLNYIHLSKTVSCFNGLPEYLIESENLTVEKLEYFNPTIKTYEIKEISETKI